MLLPAWQSKAQKGKHFKMNVSICFLPRNLEVDYQQSGQGMAISNDRALFPASKTIATCKLPEVPDW